MSGFDARTRGGEFAFPCATEPGLTVREYLAAKAMQGLLAHDSVAISRRGVHQELAEEAVKFADALLIELAK